MSHGYQDQFGPYQFGPSGSRPTPPPRSGKMWWVIGGVVVFGGLLLVCCGGLGAVGYLGLGIMTTEIEDQLRDNAVLREKVGEIQSFELDFARSVSNDEDDIWVYQVKGTKSQGIVTVRHVTDDDGKEQIQSASLKLASGDEVDLLPHGS